MGYTPEWYEKNRQRLRLKYQEKKHENFFTFSITRGNYIIYFDWCVYNPFYLLNKCSAHVPRLKNGLVNTVLKPALHPTRIQNLKIGGGSDKYSQKILKLVRFVLSIRKMTALKWLWVFWVIDNIRLIPTVKPPTRKIWIQWIRSFKKSCAVVVLYIFVGVFWELLNEESRRCSTHFNLCITN